jgi:Repeat of unknown function (DUF5907)
MTVVTATFETLALGQDTGSVTFYVNPIRSSSNGTAIITTTQVSCAITAGAMTSPSLDPGPAQVRIMIGDWRDTYDIVIPSTGPVNLMTLLYQYSQPPASVVSSAWTAAQAAQAAQATALYDATSAAASATAAAASAAVAAGVAGVGPATTTTTGLIQLAGALGGTATSPTVPALATLAPLASPTFTGTLTTPAIKITTGAASGYLLASDASGNGTWSANTLPGNATSSTPGLIQLAGALSGTATSPTIPALATLAPLNSPTFVGTVTLTSLLVNNGTVATGNVLTSDVGGYATWQALPTNTIGAGLAFVLA